MALGQLRAASNPRNWFNKKNRAASPVARTSPNPARSDRRTGVAPTSPSLAKHRSNRSIDVPKTSASASSGAADSNSVKMVLGADERHSDNSMGLPMPAQISSMSLSSFTDKNDKTAAQGYSSINDTFTGSAMQNSDHNGLPLRSAPNGTQKSYNMGGTPPTSAINGSSPAMNGSYSNSDRLPLPNNRGNATSISTVRALSGQFGGARSQNNLRDVNASDAASATSEWSSAVGGASNSGKSGRVIEKLMAERDTLKRENALLQQEKTDWLAERSMAEEKAQRQLDENQLELHEAQATKLILRKRDRQVIELREKFEKERARAVKALEDGRVWKTKLDDLEDESKHKIANLEERLMMAENQSAILSRHWKDEKEKVLKLRAKLQGDVKDHLKKVVSHADTLNQRNQIFEESHKKMESLQRIQKLQTETYESYKAKIDDDLSQIKAAAAAREAEADRLTAELKETTDKMNWAINVKKNVKDAN